MNKQTAKIKTNISNVTQKQRSELLARVYEIILSPEWLAEDKPKSTADSKQKVDNVDNPQS